MSSLDERLQKLYKRGSETSAKKPSEPSGHTPDKYTTIRAFANALPRYAANKKYKRWKWANGIIYSAGQYAVWDTMIRCSLDKERLANPPEYWYTANQNDLNNLERNLLSFFTIDGKTLAFMRLFAAAIEEKDGNPDLLMESYFGGAR